MEPVKAHSIPRGIGALVLSQPAELLDEQRQPAFHCPVQRTGWQSG